MEHYEELKLEEAKSLLDVYTLDELFDYSPYTWETLIAHLIEEGYIEPPEVKSVRG